MLIFARLLVLVAAALPVSIEAQVLAIEHATIIPMDRDTALSDHTILIAGERITWVGPSRSARIPPQVRRVDGRRLFVMPGLADMHVHLRSPGDLPRFVAAGVTTVRNMNGRPEHLDWRRSVVRGSIVGPRIYTTGPSIFNRFLGRDPNFVRMRNTADAEKVVREQRQAGYDMIKVLNGIRLPVYNRLLEVARAARMPVVGHVVSQVGTARSLAAGQVTLEHAELSLFDDKRDLASGARAIARAGAWVGTIISDRNGRCAPPENDHRRVISALRIAGVKLLAGSDANIGPIPPGAGLHCELQTLVAAGLSPYEALVSATRNPGLFARAHLRESLPAGTVTAGTRADLLLLGSDPRSDIGAVSRPHTVILRGLVVKE